MNFNQIMQTANIIFPPLKKKLLRAILVHFGRHLWLNHTVQSVGVAASSSTSANVWATAAVHTCKSALHLSGSTLKQKMNNF